MHTTMSEAGAEAPPKIPRLWLVRHPEHFGAVATVPRGSTTLGREGDGPWPPWCDRSSVSRRHARIERSAAGLRLVDLDSHNGTWVNGSRVRAAHLTDGDVVRIGEVVLVCRWDPSESPPGRSVGELVGISAEHAAVARTLARFATLEGPVLIVGESGVGKDLAARALHAAGTPWVVVDAPALSADVGLGALFGQTAGAFPGATEREGAVAQAAGGALFVDGLEAAPQAVKHGVLRWLETREFRPVGSDVAVTSDCRVIAAAQAVDGLPPALVARFDGVVEIPPLRDRRQDIAALVRQHVSEVPAVGLAALLVQRWPGNGRSVVRWLSEQQARGAPMEQWPWPTTDPEPLAPVRLSAAELRRLLETHGGNIRISAEAVGVARTTLYRWVQAAGIDLADYR